MSPNLTSKTSPYRLKSSPFSSHGRILEFLRTQPRESRILEVGTADGFTGRALREIGFTDLAGIERNPVLAQEARGQYRELLKADLDEPEAWPLEGPFDVILCADVLEHLQDPWRALRKLAGHLAPQGRLILSMPNSGHLWFRLNILLGRFPLQERGLFDRGHLRFFTWKTLRQLVEQAGLEIEHRWMTPIPFGSFKDGRIWARAALSAETAYWAVAHLWKSLLAYQFVLSTRLATR